MSRRDFLVAMGLLATGTATCVGSGVAAAGLLYINQASQTVLTLEPPTAIPTNSPRFARPSIINRNNWGALPPNHNAVNEAGFYNEDNSEGWRIYDGEITDAYQTVVLHHSAFYEENDIETLLGVQTSHRNQRGWADIAYHYLVGQNGLIYEGRDWHVRGTHVEQFNTGSLGICLLGDFMQQAPTAAQLNSTMTLINWASERLELTHIATHRDFTGLTACPGDNLAIYVDQFANAAGLSIGTDGYIGTDEAAFCPCCVCTSAT